MVALISSLASFLTASAASSGCYSGLYVIVARGSTEPAGLGLTGSLANRVAKQVPGSKVVAVDYPATIDKPIYFASEKTGAVAAKKLVLDYQSKCPNNKIALMGWSQGGQIMTDLLCGGEGGNFNSQSAVSSSIVNNNIVAVTVFGDPTFVPNKPWDVGTSKKTGVFPRTKLSQCSNYNSILKSYCDEGDYFCASGESFEVHTSYFDKYGTQIVDFIVKQYEDSKGTGSSASQSAGTPTSSVNGNTPTPTSVATGTPSSAVISTPTGTPTSGGGGGGGGGSETSITSTVSAPATGTTGSSGASTTTTSAPSSSSPGSAAVKMDMSWGLLGGFLALMGAMI